MSDYISREDAINAVLLARPAGFITTFDTVRLLGLIEGIPTADVVPVEAIHALRDILEERNRQLDQWGLQDQVSLFERLAALTEELGELAEAISETYGSTVTHPERGGLDAIRREAVHVAAVAVAIVEAALRLETDHEN